MKEKNQRCFLWGDNPYHAIGSAKALMMWLEVNVEDGIPMINYNMIADGGGHFDGGEELISIIPQEICVGFSPENIVAWLKTVFPEKRFLPIDWDSILNNTDFREWCRENSERIIKPNWDGMRFMMHNERGAQYDFFVVSKYYFPNLSCTSGYGSDDWFFLCESDSSFYIVCFSISAEMGLGSWEFVLITLDEYISLLKSPEEINIVFWNNWKSGVIIHPDSIIEARKLIDEKVYRCGEITDEILEGFYLNNC
jgi:hypothetical protein